MNTQDQQDQQDQQDKLQFLKEWYAHERAAKFAADAAKARAWRVLHHRRTTTILNMGSQQ